MNTNLYEDLKDVLKPMSDEDKEIMAKYDLTDEEKFIKHIREQGAYQNDDGTWSCKDYIDISGMNLTAIPVKFKKVDGFFNCGSNQLTSLEGAPKIAKSHFYCYKNELTTLKGGPEYVGGIFKCDMNKLTTLKGIGEVKGTIGCHNNPVSQKKLLATIGR